MSVQCIDHTTGRAGFQIMQLVLRNLGAPHCDQISVLPIRKEFLYLCLILRADRLKSILRAGRQFIHLIRQKLRTDFGNDVAAPVLHGHAPYQQLIIKNANGLLPQVQLQRLRLTISRLAPLSFLIGLRHVNTSLYVHLGLANIPRTHSFNSLLILVHLFLLAPIEIPPLHTIA